METLGYPNRLQPTTQTPFVGAIGLTSEGYYIWYGGKLVWSGHAFFVEEIKGDMIGVSETNFVRTLVNGVWQGQYSERWLPIDSPVIRGYF